MLRIDYIFSYWIFIWFILYCLKITKYNPKFAILLGILENIIVLILMSYYNTDKSIIILFILMFIILKFIPICILHNTVINKSDIIDTCVLFLIFLFWIQINN